MKQNIFEQLFNNSMLLGGLVPWLIAQLMKVPLRYFKTHRWEFGLLFSTGGMPSSHSALVTGVALSIGLHEGFDTAAFALAFILCMVVIYDAAGIRRQAGYHARKINMLINELLAGHPISDKNLAEVLGHTPREVVGGVILGLVCAFLLWLITG